MCFYLREMLEEQYPGYISESKLQEMYGKLYQHPGGCHTTHYVGGAQAFLTVVNPCFSLSPPAKGGARRVDECITSQSGYSGEKVLLLWLGQEKCIHSSHTWVICFHINIFKRPPEILWEIGDDT